MLVRCAAHTGAETEAAVGRYTVGPWFEFLGNISLVVRSLLPLEEAVAHSSRLLRRALSCAFHTPPRRRCRRWRCLATAHALGVCLCPSSICLSVCLQAFGIGACTGYLLVIGDYIPEVMAVMLAGEDELCDPTWICQREVAILVIGARRARAVLVRPLLRCAGCTALHRTAPLYAALLCFAVLAAASRRRG